MLLQIIIKEKCSNDCCYDCNELNDRCIRVKENFFWNQTKWMNEHLDNRTCEYLMGQRLNISNDRWAQATFKRKVQSHWKVACVCVCVCDWICVPVLLTKNKSLRIKETYRVNYTDARIRKANSALVEPSTQFECRFWW